MEKGLVKLLVTRVSRLNVIVILGGRRLFWVMVTAPSFSPALYPNVRFLLLLSSLSLYYEAPVKNSSVFSYDGFIHQLGANFSCLILKNRTCFCLMKVFVKSCSRGG